MSHKQRAWLLIALVCALCGAAIWGVSRYRAASLATTEAQLQRLPTRGAVVLHIDFAALRRAGLLGMLAAPLHSVDREYRDFVEATGFNYEQDLDTALVSFAPEARYLLLRGRFQWGRLQAYARSQGGGCENVFCRMEGSTADRRISFFPLQRNLMAMAVSRDDAAASALRSRGVPGRTIHAKPSDPVWLSIPGAALAGREELPSGTRMFARPLEAAEDVAVSLGQDAAQFALKLDVLCRSEADAVTVSQQLEKAAQTLRAMIALEKHAPSANDLSGTLTSGVIRREGRRVLGRWPVARRVLQEMLSAASSR